MMMDSNLITAHAYSPLLTDRSYQKIQSLTVPTELWGVAALLNLQ